MLDVFTVGLRLLRRDAVFFGDVLGNFLALRPHVGVQLKRLEMQLGRDVPTHARKRLVERFEANHAPGAGNVRNEVDFEGGGHEGALSKIPCMLSGLNFRLKRCSLSFTG